MTNCDSLVIIVLNMLSVVHAQPNAHYMITPLMIV